MGVCGREPGMEAARGCLCLSLRCSREDSEPGTGPECVRGEGAWVMTEPGEGSVCWAARLQLGPIMVPWAWCWGWGWAWGWAWAWAWW